MDLATSQAQECSKCLSKTMRYDIKSQLFKCFNTRCGFIQSLTIITYEDDSVQDDRSLNENLNNRRFVYGSQDQLFFRGLYENKNAKKQPYAANKIPKLNEQTRQEIKDIEDRIRNEVNACKKLVKKWCEIIDDKKIQFEVLEHFLEIVNLDNVCTGPSVKRKAASSFCFIIMKYIGNNSDLEDIASITGVSLQDIVKEQEKIKSLKFSNKNFELNLPIVLGMSEENSKSEWENVCFEFLQKVIVYYYQQSQNDYLLQKNKQIKYQMYSSFKEVKLKDYLLPEELSLFALFEKNIKNLNPSKIKYEKNKVCASIVLTFCLLTNIEQLSLSCPLELTMCINLLEKSIVKFYKKFIYPNREDIIPKQDVWPRRKNLNTLKIFI